MDSVRDTACAVGCPIRKSTDHSLLAAPHGLSQRATSFIASQCQGIHQMPFRRLILIQRYAPRAGTSPNAHHTSPPQDALTYRPLVSKRPEVRPRSLTCLLHAVHDPARRPHCRESERQDSCLSWPTLPCCGSFLRTSQHQARHRLDTSGLVEADGIEPTTSCLQSRRSPN